MLQTKGYLYTLLQKKRSFFKGAVIIYGWGAVEIKKLLPPNFAPPAPSVIVS